MNPSALNLSVGQPIASGYALVLALLVAITVVGYNGIQELVQAADERGRSQQILIAIEQADAGLAKAQSAARGFFISGDETFIELHRSGLAEVESARAEALKASVRESIFEFVAGRFAHRVAVATESAPNWAAAGRVLAW